MISCIKCNPKRDITCKKTKTVYILLYISDNNIIYLIKMTGLLKDTELTSREKGGRIGVWRRWVTTKMTEVSEKALEYIKLIISYIRSV